MERDLVKFLTLDLVTELLFWDCETLQANTVFWVCAMAISLCQNNLILTIYDSYTGKISWTSYDCQLEEAM